MCIAKEVLLLGLCSNLGDPQLFPRVCSSQCKRALVQQLQRVASDLDSTHLLSALDVLDDFLGSRAWTEDLAFSIEEREVVVGVRWISSLLQHSVR
jgi:hypothetical protein